MSEEQTEAKKKRRAYNIHKLSIQGSGWNDYVEELDIIERNLFIEWKKKGKEEAISEFYRGQFKMLDKIRDIIKKSLEVVEEK